ncbi:MAG: DNA-directed RNA polymerase subunit alpha [Campylobacterales bacterium]|nr:DNA-directed RNA polymerase subunit alpha [Campylobacterales bacterium]
MKKIKTSPHIPTTVEVEQYSINHAKVIAYPYETGYAVTVAHPLKRLLLGSSVGYAATAVKIDGITHEFDSVRGMFEDVAMFIINLKNIRFKLKDGSDKAIINYTFSGTKEIKGKDLVTAEVDVVTVDNHLATLNEDATVNFSLVIQKGIGYVPSEDIRNNYEAGYIAIDAFFTPVKKVVYDIENVLVEDNPNYEKIVFDIITDGQIDPVTAFKNALATMQQQLSVFNNELKITSTINLDADKDSPEIAKLLEPIESLNLNARSYNCLDRADIKYVGELVLMNEEEVKDIKHLGKKSLDEIKAKLEEIGYPVEKNLDSEIREALVRKITMLKS